MSDFIHRTFTRVGRMCDWISSALYSVFGHPTYESTFYVDSALKPTEVMETEMKSVFPSVEGLDDDIGFKIEMEGGTEIEVIPVPPLDAAINFESIHHDLPSDLDSYATLLSAYDNLFCTKNNILKVK